MSGFGGFGGFGGSDDALFGLGEADGTPEGDDEGADGFDLDRDDISNVPPAQAPNAFDMNGLGGALPNDGGMGGMGGIPGMVG